MRVIIWGHPLHSHTHSYIHEAFHKAFLRMGHDCIWVPNNQKIADQLDFNHTLVLTEGQEDSFLPINTTAKYILHNCQMKKYLPVIGRSLLLQVFTYDAAKRAIDNPKYTKLAPCVYFERADDCKVLYQPWATDLMPEEIDLARATSLKKRESWWVGTIGSGEFGNDTELAGFQRACDIYGVPFKQCSGISRDEHIALVEHSTIAPAIVGKWQKEKGYVPCRIFKNISYGQLGLSNSNAVAEVMAGHAIVDDSSSFRLFMRGMQKKDDLDFIRSAMNFVKEHHTYVNRINTILKCMEIE